MILEKKIRQKKMSTSVNFSNSWPGLLYWKRYTWKNHEAKSIQNKTLKDEIKKYVIGKKSKIKNQK